MKHFVLIEKLEPFVEFVHHYFKIHFQIFNSKRHTKPKNFITEIKRHVWKKNHFERSVYLEWKEWKVHNIFTDLIMEGSQIVKNTSITYFHSLLPWVNKVHNCDAWALLCDVVLSRLAFVWVQTTRSAKNDYFSNLKFSLSAIEVYFQ